MNNLLQFFLICWFIFGCNSSNEDEDKINGVSMVGPRNSFPSADVKPVAELGADYVAIIPFAFSRPGQPAVTYNQEWQWWGEKPEGVTRMIKYANEHQLKIMLKPHVWVAGEGWPGDFSLPNEAAWLEWEKDYEKYVLDYARLADSMQVAIYCIGTEFRIAVKERPAFWRQLIRKVKIIYSGKITYAANWDNYQNVEFWKDLDYIGVNSYWSLSANKTPSVNELVDAWQPIHNELADFSTRNKRPILFTEYGYQSVDYVAKGHWNLNLDELNANMEGQANAYQAIFEVFWQEPWFAGGFFWKWFPNHAVAGGPENKRFTPQRKNAEKIIKEQYSLK